MPAREDIYTIHEEDIPPSPEELFSKASASLGAATVSYPTGRKGGLGNPFARDDGATRVATSLGGRETKRPLTAASLSLFLCGLGQIYNRQSQLGIIFLLTEIFYVAGHWALIRTWPIARDLAAVIGVREVGLLLTIVALDAVMVVLLLLSVWQAYRQAEAFEGGHFDGIASPIVSGAASLLFPGWGQLVNAQLAKALFFLCVTLMTVIVAAFAILTPVVGLISDAGLGTMPIHRLTGGIGALVVGGAMMWVLSVYDAVVVAGCRRHSA